VFVSTQIYIKKIGLQIAALQSNEGFGNCTEQKKPPIGGLIICF